MADPLVVRRLGPLRRLNKARSEHLSSVDMAWLRMERPENLMNVTAMFWLAEPMSREVVARQLERRLTTLPRFRARLAHDGRHGWPRWKTQSDVDLEHHVREVTLPDPGDDATLRPLVSELMARPLDRDRPLWQVHVVQNFRGGTGVLCRIHHSLGDGIALMLVFLSLTDLEPDPSPVRFNPLWRLFAEAGAGVDAGRDREARAYLERMMPTGMKLLLHREHHEVAGRELRGRPSAAQLLEMGKDLAGLALRWPDTPNRFHAPLGVPKRAAWSAPIPLAQIKALRRPLGGTVNDIIVTATAGALRRYLIDTGNDPAGQDVRATIPVNLRDLAGIAHLGNVFGLVFLDLPVGIADPKARLQELTRRTRALKRSPETLVTYGILNVIGLVPAALESLAVGYFSARATAVMTNVPGPESRVYFAGRPISDILFWVPQSGDIGLGISIGSYAGSVRVGFATDAQLVPDPERLAEAFELELDTLVSRYAACDTR